METSLWRVRLAALAVSLVLALPIACGTSPSATDSNPVAANAGAGGGISAAPLVENTLPFEGGVYVTEGVNDVSLRQTWPVQAATPRTGFGDAGEFFAFRPTDGTLYYMQHSRGVYVDDAPTSADSRVATPPCLADSDTSLLNGMLSYPIGFDGQGRLAYQCDNQIIRGDGTAVPGPGNILSVLADGRVIVMEPGAEDPATRLTVVSLAGEHGSALDLPDSVPFATATTVRGNDAFVLTFRPDEPNGPSISYAGELTVRRLDAQSAWLHVRTLHVDNYGLAQLALSDGTVLLMLNLAGQNPTVLALLPDGTQRIVWGEGTTADVGAGSTQLLVGPLQ